MEIIRHLANQELIDLAIASDEQSLRPTLEALPGWARASSQRTEEHWEQQRGVIWSRISSPEGRADYSAARWPVLGSPVLESPVLGSPVLAFSTVAALILLAGLMLNRASVAPPHPAQAADPDHELLLAVERAVHNDGPAALEPAALLAEEMVQDMATAHAPIHKKEPNHEN